MIRKILQRILIGMALLLCALAPAARPFTAQATLPATATATPHDLASSYSVKLINKNGDVTEGNLQVDHALIAYSLAFTWPTEKVKGAALIDGDTLAFADGPASCTFSFYKRIAQTQGRGDSLAGVWLPLTQPLPKTPGTETADALEIPTTRDALSKTYPVKRTLPGSTTVSLGILTLKAESDFLRTVSTFDNALRYGIGLSNDKWIAIVTSPLQKDRCGVGLATLLDDNSIEGSYVQLNSTATSDFLGLKDEP